MAAIDFPASPVVNQTFLAPGTGTTYVWNGTLWLVTASTSASAGGDFFATGVGGAMTAGAYGTLIPPTVVTGNTNGAYSTSTGRYVPPAGRYTIFGWLNSSGVISQLYIAVFKNGVILNANALNSGGATTGGYSGGPSIQAVVDANGTDYFELKQQSGVGGVTLGTFAFGGYPITGVKGPPGDAGTALAQNAQAGSYTLVLGDANGHLYHAVAAAAATWTIPADASVAYPIGTTLSFVNDSANNVTIAITTDTMVLSPGTTTGSRTLATGGVATALKVTSTRWLINGTGLT